MKSIVYTNASQKKPPPPKIDIWPSTSFRKAYIARWIVKKNKAGAT